MPLSRLIRFLSRPALLHWLLPYMMALIFLGTVAQKYIGLYASQRMFFSSFVFLAYGVPLPGLRIASALLLISLLAKLIAASPWRRATAGIFIAHLGVALLLIGGLVTAAASMEGYIALAKDASSSEFYDYHNRELAITKNGVQLLSVPFAELKKGNTIPLPFPLTVTDSCRNCTMAMRSGGEHLHGPAQKVQLSALPSELEDERNLTGVEFVVSGAGAADGTYISFEPMEHQPEVILGSDHYTLAIRHATHPLPFSLTLLESKKELHPGTDTPRSYSATVLLTDGDLRQRAVLTMNHPLRYKGYTIYESSFNQSADSGDTRSVSFAVVQNYGRVFPYAASITLCIGLLLHLALRLPPLLKRSAHED